MLVSDFVLRISNFLWLGSFEELDAIPLFQGDNRFLPVGPLPEFSSQPLHFAEDSGGPYAQNLHLEEVLDSRLDLNLICVPVDLENVLMIEFFLIRTFLGDQRLSDNLLCFLHETSTPWIFWIAGLSKIKCS